MRERRRHARRRARAAAQVPASAPRARARRRPAAAPACRRASRGSPASSSASSCRSRARRRSGAAWQARRSADDARDIPRAHRRGAAPRRALARQGAHAARRLRGDRGRPRSERSSRTRPRPACTRRSPRCRASARGSADIFLLFCLGRADAFAAGDLALQTAAANALGLAERPSREALLAIAERWRPWRGVAAHLLWADYKVAPMGASRPEKRLNSLQFGARATLRRRSRMSQRRGTFTELIRAASIPAETLGRTRFAKENRQDART